MFPILKSKLNNLVLELIPINRFRYISFSLYSTTHVEKSPDYQKLNHIVSNGIGGLDELEASLDCSKASITSTLVTQILDSCKTQAPSRRILRFFSWSRKTSNPELGDEVFNYAIRVIAEKKDTTDWKFYLQIFKKQKPRLLFLHESGNCFFFPK